MSQDRSWRPRGPLSADLSLAVDIPPDLLADLDAFIEERRGFGEELSRPEALRVLAAEALVKMGLRKP